MSTRSMVLACAALIVTPAFGAEFYIVQDIEKQTCVVSQEPPKDDGHAVVGDGGYGDEASAAADMSKMLACNKRDGSIPSPPRTPTGLKTQP